MRGQGHCGLPDGTDYLRTWSLGRSGPVMLSGKSPFLRHLDKPLVRLPKASRPASPRWALPLPLPGSDTDLQLPSPMLLSPEATVGQSRREQLPAGLERNHCWPRTQELTSLLFLVSLLLLHPPSSPRQLDAWPTSPVWSLKPELRS